MLDKNASYSYVLMFDLLPEEGNMPIGKYMGQSAFKHILEKGYIISYNFKYQRHFQRLCPMSVRVTPRNRTLKSTATKAIATEKISIKQV